MAQKACFTDDTHFGTYPAKGRGLKCKPGEVAASPNKMAFKLVAHVVKGQLEVDREQRYAGQTKARTVAAEITYPTRIDPSMARHDDQRASLKPFAFNCSTFVIERHSAGLFAWAGQPRRMVLAAATPGRMTNDAASPRD